MEYNSAFFGLYQNLFLVLESELGRSRAIELFGKIMVMGLKKAYDASSFSRGNPEDFARVVGARDNSVGLRVEFPIVENRRIVYQFWTDPFPGLKGKIEPEELDATYMQFKVSYLLGDNWYYKTTKHIWHGNDCTEHVIEEK